MSVAQQSTVNLPLCELLVSWCLWLRDSGIEVLTASNGGRSILNSLAKFGVWRCTLGLLRQVGQGTVPARTGIRFFLTLQAFNSLCNLLRHCPCTDNYRHMEALPPGTFNVGLHVVILGRQGQQPIMFWRCKYDIESMCTAPHTLKKQCKLTFQRRLPSCCP